ncbi:aromatic ring-hydroxylating dioxygenase subunit alpha [Henriciella sp. AS95]|uniref:aromatic ring-hydroxylating oxygenase subunit alpha n=1 Tax=Henriciella sp. AS95 TaxID=3135782 RepID=UPI0031752D5D
MLTTKEKQRTGPKYGLSIDELNDSQIQAIKSIPAHEDSVAEKLSARRPASYFLSEDHYQLEQEKIFRRQPVPLAPSSAIPANGSILALDGYGVPVLLTRDKQGVLRAFLNACTHKGALLHEGCGAKKAGSVTCPYHAWTFGLDGAVRGVPREETYADFEKSERPLRELPSLEAGGIIWGILNPDSEGDFSAVNQQISDDFDCLKLPGMHMYGYRRFELEANWKLVMEPFLEGYHVQRLHVKSIGPLGMDMFADVVGVQERFGRDIRQTSGRGDFTPEVINMPDLNIRKYVTHAYNLFPNTVVITSPYYTSVMIIMPRGAGKSSVDYYMLTDSKPDNAKAEELYAKSYEVIQDVFGNEDFKASETCQIGLASGAIPDVIYCGMESAIPLFYEGIDAALEA